MMAARGNRELVFEGHRASAVEDEQFCSWMVVAAAWREGVTPLNLSRASLVAQLVKRPPAMQETWVRSLGWEDSLEKGKATHSIFWPGEFHGLYSPCGFPGGSHGKASACNMGDLGSIPGSGRSPREGNGNPLQYFCLENSMEGGDW